MDKTFIIFGQTGGHPNYRANSEKLHKGRNIGIEECCVYCGKHSGSTKTFVFLSNDSRVITKQEGNGIDDLSLYPVGSDCAKLARKAGHTLYNWDGETV